jgi:carbonic anhydrase
MTKLPHIFELNEQWAESLKNNDSHFFERLSSLQRPKHLWIGCSDSRVPANQITGMLPGEIFVHRNVGNIVWPTDLNCLSVLQYGIEVLGVEHIIVCGHYGCGAIQAVSNNMRFGIIDYWLGAIRKVRDKHQTELQALDEEAKLNRLCELNVLEQAKNVCATDIVQDAWRAGKELTVHGWIYSLSDGRLRDLSFSIASLLELESYLNSAR